jgi:hypothetical protein
VSALFADGRIIDAILALVAVEAALLVALARRSGRVRPAAILANLAAGAGLLAALRLALAGAAWPWIGLALAAALAAHLADLQQRFSVAEQREGRGDRPGQRGGVGHRGDQRIAGAALRPGAE